MVKLRSRMATASPADRVVPPALVVCVKRLSRKKLVLIGTAAAVALLELVLLLGPFGLRYGVAVGGILAAALALYVIRALRRIGKRTAQAVLSLRNLQRRLKQHEAHLDGAAAALSNLVSQDRFELVAVLDAQAKAVEAVSSQLSDVRERLNTLATRTPRQLTQADRANFAQIEALLELRDLVPRRAPMPPTRGFPAAPTSLLNLVHTVLERKPGLVVECGSGASSIWVGYALERLGGGRCIALEHDLEFAQATREMVERHGLSGFVEVRDAPLRAVDVDGETFQWYDPEALRDVRDADLVFVDGPPGFTGPLARFPAVPVLKPLLSAQGAVVILDDAGRPEEQAAQQRWCEDFGATVIASSTVESGWTSLSVPA
jgi:predicted O-methyltransferase YrrM